MHRTRQKRCSRRKGTLDLAEARAAEARIAAEPAFAAEVRAWEARLFPLAALVPAVAPPAGLWTRIEASTGGAASAAARPVATANDNRVGWWRAAALGAAAIAAGLAIFIGVRPVPTPLVAVLAPAGSTAALLVAVAGARWRLAAAADRGGGGGRRQGFAALGAAGGGDQAGVAGAAACGWCAGAAWREGRHAVAGEFGAQGRVADRSADGAGGLWGCVVAS